ncbi:thioredoxin-dependent thiol peroxidase [Limisphaera ngatamarikiensis]|uniref:thioredoxin-dependent peroxiredoxin n=1 Tax=Limisphaera ngatamarikiensis TaxID=1324935 RepID=A0A6M1RQX8_9BACT|nr:thioredoxin-dependent thiol peroxidase [Limisphaera ngatamarikiensis]
MKSEKARTEGGLREGDTAPDFEGLTQTGQRFRLRDCRGRWVVLYFYPRDHTPGCTREACEFRDWHGALDRSGAVVVGVSTDTVASHARFADKYRLPFVLVADSDGTICRMYGVRGQKRFLGRSFEGTLRTTFLIDPEGRIRRVWRRVRPAGHAEAVLKALEELRGATGGG